MLGQVRGHDDAVGWRDGRVIFCAEFDVGWSVGAVDSCAYRVDEPSPFGIGEHAAPQVSVLPHPCGGVVSAEQLAGGDGAGEQDQEEDQVGGVGGQAARYRVPGWLVFVK